LSIWLSLVVVVVVLALLLQMAVGVVLVDSAPEQVYQ
jgi:hypothetical protein